MKDDRRTSPHEEARRRWGKARVVAGGLAVPRPRGVRRQARTRLPGTAAERRFAERVVGRRLSAEELIGAIKLLRAGAKLKELEINHRIELLLDPPRIE
jgi:hypothetical protein